MPFGDWLPGEGVADNPLVEAVLPFSEGYGRRPESGMPRLRNPEALGQVQGRKLILVYPPAQAEEALRAATPADYRRARELLDVGDVKPALDLLAAEMKRHPRNDRLAREVIGVCRSARQTGLADDLTRRAVEGGTEVPELLLRHADRLAKAEPRKALEYYRKAARGPWPPAEAFLALGRHYAAAGRTDLAECCWRRAHRNANASQRVEVRKLLGLPQEPQAEGPPDGE
jgi:tetratricopeptide (TPR) repeat protein